MTYYVSSGTLNPTHSLINGQTSGRSKFVKNPEQSVGAFQGLTWIYLCDLSVA